MLSRMERPVIWYGISSTDSIQETDTLIITQEWIHQEHYASLERFNVDHTSWNANLQ